MALINHDKVYTFQDSRHGILEVSRVYGNSGEGYHVIRVNGIDLGESSSRVLEGFFRQAGDETLERFWG